MAHNTFKIKSILAVFVLCFLCAGQPIGAASPPASDTTAKPVTPEKDDSKGAKGEELNDAAFDEESVLSLIHISEPTRRNQSSRMPSSA